MIDKLISKIIEKKNPCIVGLDPERGKIPACYKNDTSSEAEGMLRWAKDVIDSVADIVPAVKPQIAFFEALGADGIYVFEETIKYAHSKDLVVIDDCKRGDIGNTAKAYAYAHLAKNGPINADFITVSPFLGTDSLIPFAEIAAQNGKGIFILVKTSNPCSAQISDAINAEGEKISNWLASEVDKIGKIHIGKYGYSAIGAVVGATFPKEAGKLREIMKQNFLLVPGFGAQGGSAEDVIPCFHSDGLGAVINSSRGVLYHHLKIQDYDNTRKMYLDIVRKQAVSMQKSVYSELKSAYPNMTY